MSKYVNRLSVIALAFLLPVMSHAQGDPPALDNIDQFIEAVQDVVNALIPLASGLALLAFFYGLAKYIFQADDEEAQASGKRIMIGGIVALFLIAAVGGIITFIGDALGIDTTGQGIDPTNIDTSTNAAGP